MTARPKALAPSGGLLFLTGAAFLVTLLSTPEPDTLVALTGAGVPDLAARLLLHATPVALVFLVLLAPRFLMRGWPKMLRLCVYGLLGGLVGYATAFCIDAFGAVSGQLSRMIGPVAEAEPTEAALWGLTGVFVFLALMVGLVGAFGRRGAQAIQMEDVDPEALDVRRPERGMMIWAAVGMLISGVACGALALARQAPIEARLAPVIVALVSCALSIAISWHMWRAFDEMQRRHVVDGFAASAIVLTLGAFVWAAAQALGYAPTLDAALVFVVLTVVQVTSTGHAASRAANWDTAVKPA